MVKYMNRKHFFQMDISEIDCNDLLDSLKDDKTGVLKEKYNWVLKINEDENKRHEGLRNKAGLLLGLQIGFASLLLNGAFFDLFYELEKTKLGLELTVAVIVFIFATIFIGIYYSLKVGIIPQFRNVIDPTLSLEFYDSESEWLKKTITETLIVYKKNLHRIALDALSVRRSFYFFLAAVFASILIFIVINTYNFVTEGVNFKHLLLGLCLGILLVLVVRCKLINEEKDNEK